MQKSDLSPDALFFYDNAGFSYDPATETKEAGRVRCAASLAEAEARGRAAGLSFHWKREDFAEGWLCLCYGTPPPHCPPPVLASVGCVDFGNGEPWGDPYKRVTEAELAAEVLTG